MSAELLGLAPASVVRGAVRVPGSKSIAQRAVVLAALAPGRTRLAAMPDGEDVASALNLVRTAGARVERLAPAAFAIDGRPPGPHRGWRGDPALEAGESGTLARLATAAFAFCGDAGRVGEVRVRGTLAKRASPALFAALRGAGVRTDPVDATRWPVMLTPIGPPSELHLEAPGSSQEVSALLVALASWPGESRLVVRGTIPSRPYLALTIDALTRFGAHVVETLAVDESAYAIRGPLRALETPLAIEPDASAAAVALAAACLSGGSARIDGLGSTSLQGDARVVAHLAEFGCDARAEDAALVASGFPNRCVDLDLEGEPDLAPVIAVVAAAAARACGGRAILSGLGTLPGKESSRIEVLAGGLAALGFECVATRSTLAIAPGTPRVPDAPLDPRGDHRMAFAFALMGLLSDGVLVRDPDCVGKSWPEFWRDLERAGASIARAKP